MSSESNRRSSSSADRPINAPKSAPRAPRLSSDSLALSAPRHWPSWLVVFLVFLLAQLPLPLRWALGHGVGRVGSLVLPQRRVVARVNLSLCMPGLDDRAREKLLREHFGWLGVAAVCQGISWGASARRLRRLVRFENRDVVEGYIAARRPVILLVPHFVGLELGGTAFTALVHPGTYMYQRIRNPVFDAVVRHGRSRFGSIPAERQDDLRALIRRIRRGTAFYYFPDQDPGRRRGVFVPFCGVAASTVPTLGRIARLSGAVVIPTFARYLPGGRGLEISFDAPMENLPSGDDTADAARMNRVIEQRFRSMPGQYFWVHRRFKTRPDGEPPLYPASRRRLRRRKPGRVGAGE
jgi:KDO2-lipid IV(A) lauroyltransferase